MSPTPSRGQPLKQQCLPESWHDTSSTPNAFLSVYSVARSLAHSLTHSLTHSWLDVSVFGCFPELHDTVPLLLCAQANAVVIRRQSNMSSSIYLCMAATSAGRRQYCGRWLTPRCRISGDNFLLRWTLSGTPETFTKHSLRLIRYAACLLMLQSFMLCQPIPSVTSAVQIFSLEQPHGL